MMNLKRLFLSLAMLLLVGITGCRTTDGKLCISVSPKGETFPTCTTCVLAWGPNATIVEGTVNNIIKSYAFARVQVDLGLSTALDSSINLMSNNQVFASPLTPTPVQMPKTAVLNLYWKYNTIYVPDPVTIPTIR
jgi:hypothetical protein